MKSIFVILISFFSGIAIQAQDTVKMMQYNLLNYGVYTSYCSTSNNEVNAKSQCLKTIIKYVKPDILTVNEMSSNPYYHQLLLDSALNVDGVSYYNKSDYTNYAGSNIINMLYYNSIKFTLKSQTYISTSVRDINIYKLYYNSSDLNTTHDTAFINCFAAHLKAGNTTDDATDRALMTLQLMTYINYNNVGDNYTVSGDFNVYTGSEQAFQNLINYSNSAIRFNDPINQIGNWNNNAAYAPYHTQSTHTVSGCAAGGGLDDRFDFILISNKIKNGPSHYTYIPGSYWAVGQDGNRFNQAINNPVNNSVPSEVANALYGMSDHLPIILKLKFDKTIGLPNDFANLPILNLNYNNPITDKLNLTIIFKDKTDINIQIVSIYGQIIYQSFYQNLNSSFNCDIPMESLKKGIYFLRIIDGNNHQLTKKIIKV